MISTKGKTNRIRVMIGAIRFWKPRWIHVALWACVQLICATDAVLATSIDEIRDAWRRNADEIRTLQYIGQMEETGQDLDAIRKELYGASKDAVGAAPPSQHSEFAFSFSGDKVAYVHRTDEFDFAIGKNVTRTQRAAFTGTETRILYHPNLERPFAQIVDGTQPYSSIGNNIHFVPLWLASFPSRLIRLKDNYAIETLSIRDDESYFDGKPSIELVMDSKRSKESQLQLIIDPGIGYRVRCMRTVYKGKPRIEDVLEYETNTELGYVLSGWKSTLYSRTLAPTLRIIGKVNEIRVNDALEASTFSLSFPKGTRVVRVPQGSRDVNQRKYFIQTDDKGTLRPAEQGDDPYQQPKLTHRGNFRSVGIGVTLAAVIAIGVAVFRKHRR